jgi:hypothetical protein
MDENNNRPTTIADLNALEERLAERIDHVESTLLIKFQKLAQTFEVRPGGALERRRP